MINGDEFPGYYVRAILAESSVCTIFTANRARDDMTCILKRYNVSKDSTHSLHAMRHFSAEIEALTAFHEHPLLPQLLGFGHTPNSSMPFLVLEHIDGVDIASYARSASRQSLLASLAAACRFLDYFHRRGFIHGDLKSAHLLVPRHSSAPRHPPIKVIDFGSSHRELTSTFHDALVLTPSYAAPETFTEGRTTYSSDLYAVGRILSECLLERVDDCRDTQVSDSSTDQHFEREMQAICAALLAPNPYDRTPSALTIANKLESLSQEASSPHPSHTISIQPSPSLVGLDRELQRVSSSIIQSTSTATHAPPLLIRVRAIQTPMLEAITRQVLLRAFRNGFSVRLACSVEDLTSLMLRRDATHSRPWVLSLCLPGSLYPNASQALARLWHSPTPPAAILVVGSPQQDSAVESVFASLAKDTQRTYLTISTYSKRLVADSISDSLGVPLAPPDLVSDLHAISGGHPLLIDAFLREYCYRGLVSYDQGVVRYTRTAITHDLALSVCSQVIASLDRTDATILRLVCTSAAPLSRSDIAHLLDYSLEQVTDALGSLSRLSVISLAPGECDAYLTPASGLRLALTHPQDAHLLGPLHNRLASHFDHTSASAFDLACAAQHYAAIGDAAASLRCYVSSGRALVADGHYHHAVSPLREARTLAGTSSPVSPEIHSLLATALLRSGQHHDCRDMLMAYAIPSTAAPGILVSLSLSRAYCDLALSHYSDGIAHARHALRLARTHALRAQGLRALVVIGDGLCALEKRVHGRRVLFRCLAAARRSKELSSVVDALRIIGSSHWREGDYRLALNYERRRSRLLRRAAEPRALATSLLNTGILLSDLGKYAAARHKYRVVRSFGRSLSLPHVHSRVLVNLGETFRAQGLFKPAIRLNELAGSQFREAGYIHHSIVALLNQVQLLSRAGYPGPALRLARQMGSSHVIKTIPSLQLTHLLTWSYLLISLGAYGSAARIVARAIRVACDTGLKQSLLELHILNSLCQLGLGRPDESLTNLREATDRYQRSAPFHVQVYAEAVIWASALASRLDGSTIVSPLLRVMAVARGSALRPVLSECHLVHGFLLLEAGKPGEAAASASLAHSLGVVMRNRDTIWRSSWLLARACEAQLLSRHAFVQLRRAAGILRETSLDIDNARVRRTFLSRLDIRQVTDHYRRLRSDFGRRSRYDTAALRRSESLSRRMLASLGEIGRQISYIRDMDDLLDRILDLAIENVGAERGIVLLAQSGDRSMQVANARGLGGTDLADQATFSRSVVAKAAAGHTVHITDIGQDPALSSIQSVIVHQIKSVLCVPMRSHGEVLGVIYLDTQRRTQIFTDKERTFVESFASQAAIAIENARIFGRMREENAQLRREAGGRFPELVGRSAPMRQLQKLIASVVDANCTVLITGESGTGKGVIARAIHTHGPRRDGPFLTVDCGALPENLLEGELFGYKRGAFTGAERDRVGLLEEANGGTLFLDEIANTSIGLQARLLRVLQEREIRRLGENQPRRVNVRVIAATNADLPSLISQGRFRQDLYYRLNVISVAAPPLRDRREDIPLLVASFLERFARDGKPSRLLGPGVVEALQRHSWPGNVRELENLVERIVILSPREVITLADLPEGLRPVRTSEAPEHSSDGASAHASDPPQQLAAVDGRGGRRSHGIAHKTGEQIMIEDALRRFQGDKTKAARFIGWNRQKLYRRIKSFSIPVDFGKAA